ncbi:MAG TPA: hypothetical protein VGA66_17940 [Mycobacterium sp.]
MTTASEQLVGYANDPRYYEVSRAELEPLWLAAANERLGQQCERIPVLARLTDDLGIKQFESLGDLIPLLFAHSNYKSYPEAFIDNGRWNLMNQWLDTLSSNRVEGVDVDGLNDQDDWIERLHANGHPVYVTSGTTGKNSYLPATVADREFSLGLLDNQMNWTYGQPNQDRAVFVLGPKYGPHRAASHFRRIAELFGRPEATFFLTEDQMRLSEVSRSAAVRRKLAAGTAMPSEIAALERESAARQTEMAAKLDELVDKLIEYRREPMVIGGFWAQYWMIVERARARGVRPGEFHPDTRITGGGGNKGGDMPPDFKEQILEFFGIDPANVQSGYGMSELSAPLAGIDGRYRPMPWVIPLLLDDTGQELIERSDGQAEGRFAFFDVALQGRWGGVITGDRVSVDFSTPNISVVHDSITRYSTQHGGDDKLTCAGTIDAYVRGVIA